MNDDDEGDDGENVSAEDDALRRRLEALGRSVPASEELTGRVMRQIVSGEAEGQQVKRGNPYIRRWVMRGSIGLAACAVIGTFLWTQFVTTPQAAYGIDDARQKLANVNSLHVAGKGQDGTPFEVYAARPDRCYRLQAGQRVVQTSAKNMVINDAGKRVMVFPGDALDSRFLVESILQNDLLTQLVGRPEEKARKVRSERVGDADVDVYEATVESGGDAKLRREIFLNPRTGMPVKTVLYLSGGAGEPEEPISTIDRIEANGPEPAGVFTPPPGYEVEEMNAPPEQPQAAARGATPFGSAQAGTLHLDFSYTFDLGGKALLACWSLYDDGAPGEDMKLPAAGSFSVTGAKGGYNAHLLRADAAPDGRHWRWSLLIPADPSVPVNQNPPTITVEADRSVMSVTAPPVKFERSELARFIAEAQQRTLAPGGKPLTLEEIERAVREKAGQ